MPPETSPCHPTVTPTRQFLPREPPGSQARQHQPPRHNYHYRGGTKPMTITKTKLILVLVFSLSGMSILRLLKISVISSFSSPLAAAWPRNRLSPSKSQPLPSTTATPLTEKEFHLLSNLISLKAPCNLLVFGLEQPYINLSRINSGGNTVFLEDNPEKMKTIKRNSNHTRIYRVAYETRARDAYKLLKHARKNPACGIYSGSLRQSNCSLALTKLPKEVYKRKWDVVVVDGPRGDTEDAPGRMAAIYTASVIARNGNMTDVVVHDVDRIIERWFAWEFLCDENLVYSKGKLWDFRIAGNSKSTAFCAAKTILIE
ncbi:hypothetical protein RHSIM_Rhsim08G0190400 [Rhododendron simsii]|uniref:Polysaccharide biosynthesis domain-containing protein n=1 Tax=Rhododendron simsii TaxID=118357 RepID=A0A834GIP6_RHOSS|nr:hypothetical protein RHSIM_Rhsim08G0190400 [Rhododendron simsii]